MYSVLLGECNPPEYDIHTRGKTFQPDKREACAKHAESHHCELSIMEILFVILACFLRFLKGNFFRISLTESEGSDQF